MILLGGADGIPVGDIVDVTDGVFVGWMMSDVGLIEGAVVWVIDGDTDGFNDGDMHLLCYYCLLKIIYKFLFDSVSDFYPYQINIIFSSNCT